jgi:hypothetical protein
MGGNEGIVSGARTHGPTAGRGCEDVAVHVSACTCRGNDPHQAMLPHSGIIRKFSAVHSVGCSSPAGSQSPTVSSFPGPHSGRLFTALYVMIAPHNLPRAEAWWRKG